MPSTTLEKKEAKAERSTRSVFTPPLSLYESADSYVALINLPGADENQIKIQLDRGVLTITASLAMVLPAGLEDRYSEMRLGDYKRTIDLDDHIDEDRIEAICKFGLLKLTLPKTVKAKAHKITVKKA